MKKHILLLLVIASRLFAAEQTTAGRITYTIDESQWTPSSMNIPGAETARFLCEEGNFLVLVMPEKSIAGGMASAESRKQFVEGLTEVEANVEDIKATKLFGKNCHQFVGRKESEGVTFHFRIVLIVDSGEMIVLLASARKVEPLEVAAIKSAWDSIRIK